MKKSLPIVILFAVVLLSCGKSKTVKPDALFIAADKLTKAWVAQPAVNYFTKDTLLIQGYHPTGEENLIFKLRFTGKGDYVLAPGQASFYTTLGQDVLASKYKLDTTATNTITVNSFAVGTGVATGSFQLHFIKTYGADSFPQVLTFTNGKFWVVVPPNQ